MARYYQLPVGNLCPEDGDECADNASTDASLIVTLAIDVHVSRALWGHNHVLWATRDARPDLGGKELDDARCDDQHFVHILQAQSILCRLLGDWHELGKSSSVLLNAPSMATGVCVELSLGALAIAALVHAGAIDDAAATAFGTHQLSVEQMVAGEQRQVTSAAGDDTHAVTSVIRYVGEAQILLSTYFS